MHDVNSTLQARRYQQAARPIPWSAFILIATVPLVAHAQDLSPVTGTMTAIHGFLQSMAIRTLAAIAVIGVGITAMAGRMRWAWAGSVVGGIVLVFGADQFVSFFTTSAGG